MSNYRHAGADLRGPGAGRAAGRLGLLAAACWVALLPGGPAFAQPPEKFYRVDPRLQVLVSKEWKGPTLEDMVEWLAHETGLPITVVNYEDYPLKGKPIASEAAPKGVPVWTVMRALEDATNVHGRWLATENGYQFVIEKVVLPQQQPPGGPGPGGRWPVVRVALIVLGALALTLVLVLVGLRRGAPEGKVTARGGKARPAA